MSPFQLMIAAEFLLEIYENYKKFGKYDQARICKRKTKEKFFS